jgi:hypothetical protein
MQKRSHLPINLRKDIDPRFILSILFLLILIIATFRQLPQTFYQQDEWLGSGQVTALGYEVVTRGLSPLQVIFADGRPLSRLFGAFFFSNFAFDVRPLAYYSIFFHFLNTILVFLIAYKLFSRYFSALIVSVFFGLNSISHQTVTWFAASFGAQPSAFLIFLSIYLYLLYLDNEKKLYFYSSFIAAITSLYFKEIGIFLFIFLPIIGLLFSKNFSISKEIKNFLPIVGFVAMFVFYRLFQMLFIKTPSSGSVYLTSTTNNIFLTLLSRIIMYPLSSFSLIFIPYQTAMTIAIGFMDSYYPYIRERISRWDQVAVTAILDVFAMLASFILFLLLFVVYKKKKELRKIIIFALVLFFLSLAPYFVISKDYAYLEPRYYYITIVASGIILAVFFEAIVGSFRRNYIFMLMLLLVFLSYMRYHVFIIRSDVAHQVDLSNERKQFLSTLNYYLPTLQSDTNIFYFTGSKSWLVEGNKTPFQHGFGYSVMAIYYHSGKVPKELLTREYLFMLGDQGIQRKDGKIFGYFNDYADLSEVVNKYNISSKDVHAFYYDWDKKELKDITASISAELAKIN